MSDDMEQVFAEAVKATKALTKLPYVDYAHRLHSKVRGDFQTHDQALQALGTLSTYYEYDLKVAGPKATSTKLQELVVKAGGYVESIWTAKVNNKGDSDDSSVSWIEIVENGLNDRCQVQFALHRV
ncbi:hypothetical protein P170DRAFT_481335 [Aspergillus steynii IBT 23096]|uniref:Uncharacterized protein n=1 Tax=Aspergillus steynii IBT 23096 TaxID=1392250 RepID=A0A2I2FS00_9EURO|nr:uncharacterized protein P170DRAFT_481335 [Aspergillus steynii IBT 23096]PLB43387.1 hypothetical protein P170DRAFT_481335 [Aspergillus steynii IBT 23096]